MLGRFRRRSDADVNGEPEAPGDMVLDHVEVAERIDDGVVLVGPGRVVGWLNPAARRVFGGPQNPVGRPLLEIVRDHRVDEMVERTLRSGRDESLEVMIPVSGGVLRVYAARLSSGSGACLIIRDVSRLRYLETVRQQFVANLSHELRTPLAGLDLAAQTLAGQLPADGEARVFMDRILQESQRLAAIVLTLTQLAALDAEEIRVERGPFSVASLVQENVARFEPRARAAGLALRAEIPADQVEALGDRSKTDQALQSIVDNALKFTPAGEVVVAVVPGERSVEIAVRDTGIGIPPEHLSRIFERFYKVDRVRGREVPGTGLGLSIARHLVELQGGTLSVESAPGAGTTMHIRLSRP
jgi:two-component system phosphate regulon sensor histidine kinase PhoR